MEKTPTEPYSIEQFEQMIGGKVVRDENGNPDIQSSPSTQSSNNPNPPNDPSSNSRQDASSSGIDVNKLTINDLESLKQLIELCNARQSFRQEEGDAVRILHTKIVNMISKLKDKALF